MRFSRTVDEMCLLLALCSLLLMKETSCFSPGLGRERSTTVLQPPVLHSAVSEIPSTTPEKDDGDSIFSMEEIQFKKHTKELCNRRNLSLDGVKNARDLATVKNSPLKPGKIFRTGRLGEASEKDIRLLMDTLQLRTLIDLRSPSELKDDPTVMRPEVYGNFTNVVWKDRGRARDGRVKELRPGELPVKSRPWKRSRMSKEEEDDADELASVMAIGNILEDSAINHNEETDEEGYSMPASQFSYKGRRRQRLFVSLMNEWKYVKGTLGHVRKRDVARTVLKSPGSIFSRRVRDSCKKPFLDEINEGGLEMLNQILFRYGAPGIKYALEICSDEKRHPIAFYCTAGKDRTGALAAIILSLCGADTDAIVEDYSLSANVYADMGDNQAMVGALSQRSLDPEVFLTAPPQVMRDTLAAIQEQYGGVEEYCEWIGFGKEKQEQLRKVLLK